MQSEVQFVLTVNIIHTCIPIMYGDGARRQFSKNVLWVFNNIIKVQFVIKAPSLNLSTGTVLTFVDRVGIFNFYFLGVPLFSEFHSTNAHHISFNLIRFLTTSTYISCMCVCVCVCVCVDVCMCVQTPNLSHFCSLCPLYCKRGESATSWFGKPHCRMSSIGARVLSVVL